MTVYPADHLHSAPRSCVAAMLTPEAVSSDRAPDLAPEVASSGRRALPALLPRFRRVWKHRRMMHYHRLIALVVVANVALIDWDFRAWWSGSEAAVTALSDAALANFALAILVRQQYVVNALFWLATRAPTSWPLRVRWLLGKVYHFGGLHVGGALAGTVWFVLSIAVLTSHGLRGNGGVSVALYVVSYSLVAVLLLIVVMALRPVRSRFHDNFERTHRFGGWTALALLWAQTILTVRPDTGTDLLRSHTVWILAVLTVSIALPWLRLRRVRVAIERPSSHVAVARFSHGVTPFAGSSTAVSRHPLGQWHSFANVPTPGQAGFRLTISRAGDWTAEFIDDKPDHVWVKGVPTAGVANIETLFTKVLYVATGSGIGPVLPHLLAQDVPAHLVWATRSPRATYGDALVEEILAVQPDATIWDTTEHGKPDMVELAYEAYRTHGAEAVICISNEKLTWRVIQAMEERGIPAYGAIWDS